MVQEMSFEEMRASLQRHFLDRADYLLEQFGRVVAEQTMPAAEKETVLDGVLHNLGHAAMDVDGFSTGQLFMNRAFHIAQANNDEALAEKVALCAYKFDYRPPDESIKQRLMGIGL